MEQQITFHIVGGTSRDRAEQARFIYARGIHAELYADVAELIHRSPQAGLILVGSDMVARGLACVAEELGVAGIWLPLVATSEAPQVHEIVQAMKEGAFDYLVLPIQNQGFDGLLAKIRSGEATEQARARRVMVEARSRIASLSVRERQVLDWLSEGCSNKHIARALDISPRTVEIHRANMMNKLGAQHSSEAVRMQCIAGLQSTAREEEEAVASPEYQTQIVESLRLAASTVAAKTQAA